MQPNTQFHKSKELLRILHDYGPRLYVKVNRESCGALRQASTICCRGRAALVRCLHPMAVRQVLSQRKNDLWLYDKGWRLMQENGMLLG